MLNTYYYYCMYMGWGGEIETCITIYRKYHKNKICKILLFVSKSLRSSLFCGAAKHKLVYYRHFGKRYHDIKVSPWTCLPLYIGLIRKPETSVTYSYCVTTWENVYFKYTMKKAWNMVIWYCCYTLCSDLY